MNKLQLPSFLKRKQSPAGQPNGTAAKQAPGFSPELLEFQPDRVEIENQPVPFAARSTLYVLTAFLFGALIWSCLADVDRVVVAHGKIITSTQETLVQPLVSSIVRRVEVTVGQVVKPGQVLVTLDPTFATADATQVTQRVASLNLQIKRLQAEIDHKPFVPDKGALPEEITLQTQIFNSRNREWQARIQTFDTALSEHRAVLAATETQLRERQKQGELVQEVVGMHTELYDQGVASKLEKLQAESNKINNAVEVSKLASTTQERRHALARTHEEKTAFLNNWLREAAKELDTLKQDRDALLQQSSKTGRMQELSKLTASTDAVVLELGPYAPGAVVKEGEPIMRLAPLNVPLEAEVEIEAREIGYVRVNDPCRIKLDTFPFQLHGTLDGKLRTVSEDSFKLPEDKLKPLFYKARIEIVSKKLDHVPQDFRLIPGMTLTGEIKVGTRKVITYFLYPLIKMFDESIRTP